nr:helix-turn-helix transcriptional regulator [uncultured Draconibacterium sp.]
MNTPLFRIDKFLSPLSEQEANVARELALGNTQKEIANKRNKSPHTVNQQRRVAMEKTHSRNVADLTRWVMRRYFNKSEDCIVNTLHDTMIVFAVFAISYSFSTLL